MNASSTISIKRDSSESKKSVVLLSIVIIVWIAILILLFAKLAMYGQASGELGIPPNAISTDIPIEPDVHTLVMAIHPRCPCSQASLYELERLLPKCENRLKVHFYLYDSPDKEASWFAEVSDEVRRRFPDAQVLPDPDGDIARLLGAYTSGSAVLYEPNGTPVFWGGITSGRGHAGDNLGSDSIYAIVDNREPPRVKTLVYGCAITHSYSDLLLDNCSNRICEIPENLEN